MSSSSLLCIEFSPDGTFFAPRNISSGALTDSTHTRESSGSAFGLMMMMIDRTMLLIKKWVEAISDSSRYNSHSHDRG